MEKDCESSNILFLESGAHSMSPQIFVALLPFVVDLTLGKILNIRE